MHKPKVTISLDTTDKFMEAFGAGFFICLLLLPTTYYNDLPDMIPTHFNAKGEPDDYSPRTMIWFLPGITLVMYVGLSILNRFPHIFNYPTTITAENAERQYRLATRMVRSLNVLIAGAFCYITYATIQTALNLQSGLGSHFLLIFIGLIFGSIIIYLVQAFRSI